MSQDFFLVNRAHQLSRLCSAQHQSPYVIPPERQLSKLPKDLVDFYAMLTRICEYAKSHGLEAPENVEAGGGLTARQRSELLAFEKVVVDNRFSSDEQVKQAAVSLIRRIFADAAYFSGLKPLAQYTDSFAFELLFPSWLNLLTALMLPRADNGKPRLSGTQQGELFKFLSKLDFSSVEAEHQLIGFLTLIASRIDAPECELLLQRASDLVSRFGASVVARLEQMDAQTRDARKLKDRIRQYLTVKHSSDKWPSTSAVRISGARPAIRSLPAGVCKHLAELEAAGDRWDDYFAIAKPLANLVESDALMSIDFSALLDKYPDRAADLMSLIVPESGGVLCEEGQACVAKLAAQLLSRDGSSSLEKVKAFALSIANRLHGFSESTLTYFCRQFVDDEQKSEQLLDACGSPEALASLTQQLLNRAQKVDDHSRFMNLLCCLSVISPDERDESAKTALQAFEAVVSNRSIGSREYSDLVSDLQANVSEAMRYLASPIMAGAGKSDRLASLYLTLNEITEVFEASGNVGNFSVVRAKYSALNMGD